MPDETSSISNVVKPVSQPAGAHPAAIAVSADAEPPVFFHAAPRSGPAAQIMTDRHAIQDEQRTRNNNAFCGTCDQACCWDCNPEVVGACGYCCGTLVDGGMSLCGFCCNSALNCGKATCECCTDPKLWECVCQIICCPILMLGGR